MICPTLKGMITSAMIDNDSSVSLVFKSIVSAIPNLSSNVCVVLACVLQGFGGTNVTVNKETVVKIIIGDFEATPTPLLMVPSSLRQCEVLLGMNF